MTSLTVTYSLTQTHHLDEYRAKHEESVTVYRNVDRFDVTADGTLTLWFEDGFRWGTNEWHRIEVSR